MRIPPDSFAFTFVLGSLVALPALSIDVSAPALVLLPFALETTETMAGVTLSLFMGGFALGQLAGGYVSDRKGRRPVLIPSLTCFTLAAAGCTLSQSVAQLLAFRLVQGFGAGACAVLSFAIIQDLFAGHRARSKRSYIAMVFAIMPMVAPALGIWLVDLGGWRATHGVLALAGAGLLAVAALGIQESRPARPGTAAKVGLWRWFRAERSFLQLAAVNAVSYGGLFAYIAGSPVVVIARLNLSAATYAVLFAATASMLALGAWLSGWLARRHVATLRVVDAGFVGSALGCLGGLTCMGGAPDQPALLLPGLIALFFCRGILAPNLQHLAVEKRTEDAGTASATLGVLQLLLGALASVFVAALQPDWKLRGVVAITAGLGLAAAVAWFVLVRAGYQHRA